MCCLFADVVKLVNTLDSGSSGLYALEGSSPFIRTMFLRVHLLLYELTFDLAGSNPVLSASLK